MPRSCTVLLFFLYTDGRHAVCNCSHGLLLSQEQISPPAAESDGNFPTPTTSFSALHQPPPPQLLCTSCEQRLGPQEQSVSNSAVHTNRLGIRLKYRVWSGRQGGSQTLISDGLPGYADVVGPWTTCWAGKSRITSGIISTLASP